MAKKDAVPRYAGKLLPIDRGCSCPLKSGPGLVTLLGCNGCRYHRGTAPLLMAVCSHPAAGNAYLDWYTRTVTGPQPEPPARRRERTDEPGQLPLF